MRQQRQEGLGLIVPEQIGGMLQVDMWHDAHPKPQHPNIANTTPGYALRKQARAKKRASKNDAALKLLR